MKYKWKVSEKPKGKYRSFEKREFPFAEYENGEFAAQMISESWYDSEKKKKGEYKPITLVIADHSEKPWKRRVFKKRFLTIDDAKEAFKKLLKEHPEIMPN